MYYLVGIRDGVHPCGNAGTFVTHYKAQYKLKEAAERFATMYSLSEVYGLNVYPQELCELDNAEFVNYVRKNGTRYF